MKNIKFTLAILAVLVLPLTSSAQVDSSEFLNIDFDDKFGVNQVAYDCEDIVSVSEISRIFGDTFELQNNLNGTCMYTTAIPEIDPSSLDFSNFDPTSFVPKSVSFNFFVGDKLSPDETYEESRTLYGDFLSAVEDTSIGTRSFESADTLQVGSASVDQAAVYFLDSSGLYNVSVVASSPGIGLDGVRELAQILDSKAPLVGFSADPNNDTQNQDSLDENEISNNVDSEVSENEDVEGVVGSTLNNILGLLENPIVLYSIIGVGALLLIAGLVMVIKSMSLNSSVGGASVEPSSKNAQVVNYSAKDTDKVMSSDKPQEPLIQEVSKKLDAQNTQTQASPTMITQSPVSPELKDYVTKAKISGMNDDQIKAELIKAGWDSESINSALK